VRTSFELPSKGVFFFKQKTAYEMISNIPTNTSEAIPYDSSASFEKLNLSNLSYLPLAPV